MDIIKNAFYFIVDIFDYIFDLRITDIPRIIAYIGASALIGYCTSLILIGFPCSVWEALTKKKVNDEMQKKVIRIVAIILFVLLLLQFLNEQVS